MSNKNTQASLFQIEGNTGSREIIRSVSSNLDHLRKVDISKIRIRPDNFNARRKPDGMTEEMWEQVIMISDLADKIYASGAPAIPILGDFHADGHFYITDGERTYRALNHLIRTGREIYPDGKTPVSLVTVLMNPPGTTDLQRRKKMYNTNDTLPFTTLQKCYYFLSFAEEYNMTHEQIAEEFKVSRQTIDNYILVTTLPADVQEKIDTGELKMSTALAEHRGKNKKTKDDGKDIPTESQERREKEEAQEKEKLRGDEDEFLEQDNTVNFAGSRGGPKEEGSGTIVVGKDSIYMAEQKLSLWKQAINRLDVIRDSIASNLPTNNNMGEEMTPEEIAVWVEREVATRMMNEYNLTVK